MSFKEKRMKPIKLMDDDLVAMIKIFKALSDPSRLRIVSVLTGRERLSVSEISEVVDLSISSVSHHLAILQHLGFTSSERVGKQVYHYLSDDCIYEILKGTLKHVR